MNTHAPNRTNFIFALLPAAGALADACLNLAHPAIKLHNVSITADGGLPAGLHHEADAAVSLTDPSLTERALSGAPLLLWSVGLFLLIALPALKPDHQPVPVRLVIPGGTFVVAALGALSYGHHYAQQAYEGDPSPSAIWCALGIILCTTFQTLSRKERVIDLKGELDRVV